MCVFIYTHTVLLSLSEPSMYLQAALKLIVERGTETWGDKIEIVLELIKKAGH